jgi:hypothetical protein
VAEVQHIASRQPRSEPTGTVTMSPISSWASIAGLARRSGGNGARDGFWQEGFQTTFDLVGWLKQSRLLAFLLDSSGRSRVLL